MTVEAVTKSCPTKAPFVWHRIGRIISIAVMLAIVVWSIDGIRALCRPLVPGRETDLSDQANTPPTTLAELLTALPGDGYWTLPGSAWRVTGSFEQSPSELPVTASDAAEFSPTATPTELENSLLELLSALGRRDDQDGAQARYVLSQKDIHVTASVIRYAERERLRSLACSIQFPDGRRLAFHAAPATTLGVKSIPEEDSLLARCFDRQSTLGSYLDSLGNIRMQAIATPEPIDRIIQQFRSKASPVAMHLLESSFAELTCTLADLELRVAIWNSADAKHRYLVLIPLRTVSVHQRH